MLFDGLYCLMVQRVSLNDRMRSILLAAAIEMLRRQGEKGAGRRSVKDDDFGVYSRLDYCCLFAENQ